MSESESTEKYAASLTDEEWNELARKVEEALAEKGELVIPSYEGNDTLQFLAQTTAVDDYRSIHALLTQLMTSDQLKTLDPDYSPTTEAFWKGALALSTSLAGSKADARALAKQIYTEEPRLVTPYLAMAQSAAYDDHNLLARRWLDLAAKCQPSLHDARYHRICAHVEFQNAKAARLQKILAPVFAVDEKFAFLLQLYEVEEGQQLYTDLHKLRDNFDDMQRIKESSQVLCDWFLTVLGDPMPAILFRRPDPPAYSPPADGKVTRLDQLPPSVAAQIAGKLLDPQLFSLLCTNKAVNALFDRPEVWMRLVQRDVMPLETVRGPFESYEWKHIYRLYNFVGFAAQEVLPLTQVLSPGSCDYVLIKEKDAEKLWAMAHRFQIMGFGSKFSPVDVILTLATDLLLLDGSPERKTAFFLSEYMKIGEIATACLLEQARSTSTRTAARGFLINFLPSPQQAAERTLMTNVTQICALRNIIYSGERVAIGALNTICFQNDFDPDFKFHPIAASDLTSYNRRRLPYYAKRQKRYKASSIVAEEANESEKINASSETGEISPENDEIPKISADTETNDTVTELSEEEKIADFEAFALACSADPSGVYRFHLRYSHPDLETERDLGVANLKFNKENYSLEGKGRDTLRGPFTIKTATSPELWRDARSNSQVSSVSRPQFLVLTYDVDQTCLLLRCSSFAYGYSGEFEHLRPSKDFFESIEKGTFVAPSAATENPDLVTGGFTLLYDIEASKAAAGFKTASSSSNNPQKSTYEDLYQLNEQQEAEKRKQRSANPNFSKATPYFEPWSYQSSNPELLELKKQVIKYSALQMEMWSEGCQLAKVLYYLETLPEPMAGLIDQMTEHAKSLAAPKSDRESEAKYSGRQRVLGVLMAHCLETRTRIFRQLPNERIARAVEILNSETHPELINEYCFWTNFLNMAPFEPQYQLEILNAQYHDYIVPSMNEDPLAERKTQKIKETIQGLSSKRSSSSSFVNTVILTSVITLGLAAVGIGAFFFGRVLSKRKD